MSSRIEQVLAYLDRDGVSEIILGVGRPLSLRRNGQVVPVTTAPVTRGQLATLVAGTALATLVPEQEGTSPAVDVEVGTRRVRVQAGRRGEEILLRIERAPASAPRAAAPPRGGGMVSGRAIPVVETTRIPVADRAERAVSSAPAAHARPAPSQPIPTMSGSIELDMDASSAALELELETSTSSPRPQVTPARTGFGSDNPAAAPGGPLDVGLVLDNAPSYEVAIDTVPPGKPIRIGADPSPHSALPRELATLVQRAHQRGASDLHVASTRATAIRVLGELVPLDPAAGPASAAEVQALLAPIVAPHQARFDAVGYIDIALESPVGGRLRANISKHQGGLKGTFRIAHPSPPTLEQLGMPRELGKVIHHHQGLVVIAGPSGHGKTTTLAALVDLVNAARAFHIITVEDPIEIVYPRKAAVVSQREVGPHTRSFAAALKGSLREDPDVIVIGELRDRETVEIALTAAETGHLVLATMSTPSAAKTIDRLVDMFPPDEQSQVRASIAGALRAIVAQRLLPSASGQGLVAAVELLTGCLPLAAMIRDDKLYQLPNLMQRGRAFGMIRLDESLLELVKSRKVSPEAALAVTENKKELRAQLERGGVR